MSTKLEQLQDKLMGVKKEISSIKEVKANLEKEKAQIEGELIRELDDLGFSSVDTSLGPVKLKERVYHKMADVEGCNEWIERTGNGHLRRPHASTFSATIQSLIEAGEEDLPFDYIETSIVRSVSV